MLSFKSWKSDLPAAVFVSLVALPLCLGISLASGAPMLSGLIAGVVGGVIVGWLSNSSLGVSGPAAGLAVIVMNYIESLGSFSAFLTVVVLAGVLQVVLGFMQAGILAYYFPSAVITGMLAGIGATIFLKQIPHALGFDRDPEGQFAFFQPDGANTFSEIGNALASVSPGPTIIAIVSLVIMVIWGSQRWQFTRLQKVIPGAVLAVPVGVLLNIFFRGYPSLALEPDQMVALPVPGDGSQIADLIATPDFSVLTSYEVYIAAIVLAVVASLETLLSVEATDKLDSQGRVTPRNRELKAQGVGNIVAGLLGGLPITQVIVRSAANAQAGGKTKLSAILHAIFLGGAVMAIPAVLNLIPLASLAAILLIVGYKLASPVLFRRMYERGGEHFMPFAVTVFGVVFSDLLIGVGMGLVLAFARILYQNFRLPVYTRNFSEVKKTRVTLAQQVTFLNKASVRKALARIPVGSAVEIDASRSVFVHRDVVDIIKDFVEVARNSGREVRVIGLEGKDQDSRRIASLEIAFEQGGPS